jgi:putative mRNA 3-end processing factor
MWQCLEMECFFLVSHQMPLIEFTDKGFYCPLGDFYIDPWKPVNKAIITHAHSDHARPGSASYLSHHYSKPLLEARLGPHHFESIGWNEPIQMNGVQVSLHPAGHIIGSSQVRVEHKGEVWVISGDYKLEDDGLSGLFEPVKCHSFISECTFGLPIYKWKAQQQIYSDIENWIRKSHDAGKTAILIAYSLGKAQRVLAPAAACTDTILMHGAVYNMHQTLVNAGWKLPHAEYVSPETPKTRLKNAVVIAPPGAVGSSWLKKFAPYEIGICSGWMQVRGNTRRRNADAGFALSDHADWNGLLQACNATGAQTVYATHGFQSAFSRYLNEVGVEAKEVHTEYGNDEEPTSTIIDDDKPAEDLASTQATEK